MEHYNLVRSSFWFYRNGVGEKLPPLACLEGIVTVLMVTIVVCEYLSLRIHSWMLARKML
jgi:hypothetical protein